MPGFVTVRLVQCAESPLRKPLDMEFNTLCCHLRILSDSSLDFYFIRKSSGTISMCQGTVPAPGASLGWILHCPHPWPWNASQPPLVCLTHPRLSLSDPGEGMCTSMRKIRVGLCAPWHLREELGCVILACQLPVRFTGVWQVIRGHSSVSAHPQSRCPVSCNDSHGKGKRLARLPCPGPRHGTWS